MKLINWRIHKPENHICPSVKVFIWQTVQSRKITFFDLRR